ncbi:MAG: RHS repeat-associated core domain-containing protein, partial [Acidimicrobiales bacterium]
SYCYDPDGNETAVVPPDGNSGASVEDDGLTLSGYAACSSSSHDTSSVYETAYTYDSTGNLLTTARPDTSADAYGMITTDTYDAAGQLATTESPAGVTTTIAYTPLGEVASKSYSDSLHSVTDSHDANGELTEMVDGTGTSSYSYDAFGDLTSYENGAGETVSYAYDRLSNPTSITYPLPSGTSWDSTDTESLSYDSDGNLASLTDLSGDETQFSYSADGLLSGISFPSAVGSESISYDNADNLEAITFTKASTSLEYSYTREPSGGIASETDDEDGTEVASSPSYDYDSVDRVTSLTPHSGSATSYGYDASGNLTTPPGAASAAYDDGSELCWTSTTSSSNTCSSPPSGATTYSYDDDGDRLSATQDSTTLASASWNGIDELSSYDDSAADMTSASYDGNGLRESDTVSSATQDFVWDTTTATPELLEDGANLYLYGPSGTPIEQMSLSSGTREYLVADALGSVRGVISSSGSILETTSYDAYGNPSSGSVATDTPFGFAGGYTDATGLVYLIGRYYDPATGQFLSVDPDVDETDQAYAYTGGDPVSESDPSGDCVSLFGVVCLGGGAVTSTVSFGFNPGAGTNAIVNIGRGASFGLSNTIANWISPGASCTVAGNSFDEFLGGAGTSLVGGEFLSGLGAAEDGTAAADIGHAGIHQFPDVLAGKSQFFDNVDLGQLSDTTGLDGTLQANGNTRFVLHAPEDIGVDRTTGLPTNIYTVIRGPDGNVITMFPGTSPKS